MPCLHLLKPMARFFFLFSLFALVLTACIPMQGVMAVTPTSQNTPTPTLSETPMPIQRASATLPPTFTPFPSSTPIPTPTDTPTLLPTLELPTLPPFVPFRQVWQSAPSLPDDSERDLNFTVLYDPDVWAQTEDLFGALVLAHRSIPYCTIEKGRPGGLPPGYVAEQGFAQVGSIYYQTIRVSLNGVLKFVNYYGGRGKQALTVFTVSFEEDPETCLADAEKVLATLQFIVVTPTPEPSATPEPTPTP